MKIAVLTDIHGNYTAFKTCVDEILSREIQCFIFLGDYAGEMAYPTQTMDLIYQLNHDYECYFIKGNKEDYWLDYRQSGEKGWTKGSSTTGALLYSYQNLRTKDLDFFATLKYSDVLFFPDLPALTICHGTPDSTTAKLLADDPATQAYIEVAQGELILCGHTHIRLVYKYAGKTVLNPGSVGLPVKSQGKAQFVLLDGHAGTWDYELVDLTYDVSKTLLDLEKAGLYEWAPSWTSTTAEILKTGQIQHSHVLKYAMSLCREAEGDCQWPFIPEVYWQQAVEVLVENR